MKLNINTLVQSVFSNLELNNFHTLDRDNLPIWQPPLVGVAAGDDPYYDFLKEHIGDFHWDPSEVFALKYDNTPASDLRVVSVAFPQTEETLKLQRNETVFPCDNWVVSRGEWEPLIKEFCSKLEFHLERKQIRCAFIDLQPQFHREESKNLGIASVWSHRHSAYAAGLGTFGLSDGFITEKGKAVRLTSFIVEASLPITKRRYLGHHDWCLYYQNGSCGACIQRCPVHAISAQGHNKNACNDYEDTAIAQYWPSHIQQGNYIFGCGLCQAGVPCQNKRP